MFVARSHIYQALAAEDGDAAQWADGPRNCSPSKTGIANKRPSIYVAKPCWAYVTLMGTYHELDYLTHELLM